MKHILLLLLMILFPVCVFAQNSTVSFKIRTISATPTISTSQYTTGMLIGGLQTLTGAGACDSSVGPTGLCNGVISSMTITDLSKQAANFDIVIFSTNPSATTFTERSALAVNAADLPKIACVISVTTQVAFSANGAAVNQNAGCVFDGTQNNGKLYAAAVIRSTATYAGTTDLTFRWGILQD